MGEPMSRKRVYVSGLYTKGDTCVNTHAAIAAGNALLDAGFAPFVPHLSHFWHTVTPRPYEDWMAIDLAWVECAHAVLRLPGESAGADLETGHARRHGIPVFDSVEAVVAWAAEQKCREAERAEFARTAPVPGDTSSWLTHCHECKRFRGHGHECPPPAGEA